MNRLVLGSLTAILVTSCAHKASKEPSTQNKRKPNAETEALIRYDYKDGEITALCDQAITNYKKDMSNWLSVYQGKNNGDDPILKFEEIQANFGDILYPLTFMGSVSKNKVLRDESSKCEEAVSVVSNEVFTNRGNYLILKGLQTKDVEVGRLLKETKFAFEMNGMSLNDKDLVKFKELKDRLSQLSVQFGQNLNNDVSTVTFTESELKGAKADFLARLKKDTSGNYIVTTKAPDYVAVVENVESAETRKKMVFAYNNRQAESNTKLLQEATQVRADIAKLMGFKTYAEYALREKMAGTSKAVFDFLNGLKNKLAAKNKSDLKVMAKFKSEVLKDSSPLAIWDVPYVANQLKIQKYNVDQDIVRQYFPAQYVVEQTLDIYSQLLGVEFRQLKSAPVWAENVQMYEVADKATHEVMAYFYQDLIPRDGKYGHAAAFPLIGGRKLSDGVSYQKPIAAIVANFTPAAPGKPILLGHSEVETYFHEFGHIMHQILTKARFSSLAGSSVKGDFVEAPSQMLENWVWNTDMLKKMSQHFEDKTKKLPDDLIARMQSARMFNSGCSILDSWSSACLI